MLGDKSIIGGLRVLQIAGRKNKRVIYDVECVHCNKKYHTGRDKIAINKYGCADCYRRQRIKGCLHPQWKGGLYVSGEFYGNAKRNARRRNIIFDVEIACLDDKWAQQKGRCIYTGLELTMNGTASLDRIDSSRGYLPGNVQFVHKDINTMKWDFSEEKFIRYLELMWRNMF